MLREFTKAKSYIIADNRPLTYYTGQGAKSLAGFGAEPQVKNRVLRGRAPEPSESRRRQRVAGGVVRAFLWGNKLKFSKNLKAVSKKSDKRNLDFLQKVKFSICI